VDGDDLHPPENIAKMHAGIPLEDEDRWPWLRLVAGAISDLAAAGTPGVVACSGLRRAYRDLLREPDPSLVVAYLRGTREELLARLEGRSDHFFPSRLIDAQMAVLEEPGPDEHPIVVPIGAPASEEVDAVLTAMGR
jgi:gluconokinase